MAPKEKKVTPKKKDRTWIVVIVGMMLFIAGILYLDHSRNKATAPSISPLPTEELSYPIVATEEIEKLLASKEPMVFYFYSSKSATSVKVRPLIDSLEMRLQTINIRLVKVSLEENGDVFNLFDVDTYPAIVIYKEKEIFRQIVKINDNPDTLFALIKEKLEIGYLSIYIYDYNREVSFG